MVVVARLRDIEVQEAVAARAACAVVSETAVASATKAAHCQGYLYPARAGGSEARKSVCYAADPGWRA
jgi:hypothetical protein